ncbi:MAG: glycosyltransferase [Desulfobacterales bacterium]|nr:glycosyltransferase [Desulfobacterales bacterium]
MKHGQTIILHLITTLNTGGAEMMLLKLLSHTDHHIFTKRVVSLTDVGSVGERILAQGIPVYALNMPNGRLTPSGLAKLWRLFRFIRPTILQTWLYHADLLGLIFGKLAGIRTICWNIRCSYMDLDKYRRSTKWTIKLCSLFSSFPQVVIANSREAVKFHVNLGYKAKRWRVIPNGFDLDKFKPDRQAKQGLLVELGLAYNPKTENRGEQSGKRNQKRVFLIGFIARYDPMKKHSTFIKAACLLLRERRDVHFILAGRDVKWGNGLLARQIPHIWKDHFHLLGERNDVENITAGLDIASSVSYGEGFPNTIGEAMACGVPCVVTDVGDSARIVSDTGRVVPPKDPDALAKAWKELIDVGEDGRHRLGIAARKRVKDYFELSQIVKQYESLYTSLVIEGM